jgi:hypothetical protein
MTTKGFLIFIGILVMLFGVAGPVSLLERSKAKEVVVAEQKSVPVGQYFDSKALACPRRDFMNEYVVKFLEIRRKNDIYPDVGNFAIGLGLALLADSISYCK